MKFETFRYGQLPSKLMEERGLELFQRLYKAIEKGVLNHARMRKNDASDYIDLSEFGFSNQNSADRRYVYATYRTVFFDHPELFYLQEGIHPRLKGIVPVYADFLHSEEELRDAEIRFEQALARELAKLDGVTDPLEQVLLLRDNLMSHCFYNLKAVQNPTDCAPWSAYGPLVQSNGVCKGFAFAMKALIDRLDNPALRCAAIGGNDELGENGEPVLNEKGDKHWTHVWNLIGLDEGDGLRWYHFDSNKAVNKCPTILGRTAHDCALISDDTASQKNSEGKQEYYHWEEAMDFLEIPRCADTRYENGLEILKWNYSPIYRSENGMFYSLRLDKKADVYRLYCGGLRENGTELAQIPLLRFNSDLSAGSGIFWRNDGFYYVNRAFQLIYYSLVSGESEQIAQVPVTPRASLDGTYGPGHDAISMRFDDESNELTLISRNVPTAEGELLRVPLT